MLKSLGYHLKRLAGTQAMTSGWSQDKKLCDKPRAWVVRLPGAFMHLGNEQDYTAFQTIVSANSAEAAWEVACMTDVWETTVMWNPYLHTKTNIMGKNTIFECNITINYASQIIVEDSDTITRLRPSTSTCRMSTTSIRKYVITQTGRTDSKIVVLGRTRSLSRLLHLRCTQPAV